MDGGSGSSPCCLGWGGGAGSEVLGGLGARGSATPAALVLKMQCDGSGISGWVLAVNLG